MDVETFESAKKNLRIQKYSDTSGRGLSHRVGGPIPKLFVGIRIQSDDLFFHSLFLVSSHVKDDFLADKKYHLKLEVCLFQRT